MFGSRLKRVEALLVEQREMLLAQSALLVQLIERDKTMATDLTALTAAVTNETTVEASAVTLLQQLSSQLASVATDPVAVAALASQINAGATALAAAITANTPAAPAA